MIAIPMPGEFVSLVEGAKVSIAGAGNVEAPDGDFRVVKISTTVRGLEFELSRDCWPPVYINDSHMIRGAYPFQRSSVPPGMHPVQVRVVDRITNALNRWLRR